MKEPRRFSELCNFFDEYLFFCCGDNHFNVLFTKWCLFYSCSFLCFRWKLSGGFFSSFYLNVNHKQLTLNCLVRVLFSLCRRIWHFFSAWKSFFFNKGKKLPFFKIRQFCPNTNVFWGHFGPLPGNLPNVLSNQSIFWPWIVMWLRFKPPWGGAGRRVGHRCLSSRFLSLGVQNTFTGSLKPPRGRFKGEMAGVVPRAVLH